MFSWDSILWGIAGAAAFLYLAAKLPSDSGLRKMIYTSSVFTIALSLVEAVLKICGVL